MQFCIDERFLLLNKSCFLVAWEYHCGCVSPSYFCTDVLKSMDRPDLAFRSNCHTYPLPISASGTSFFFSSFLKIWNEKRCVVVLFNHQTSVNNFGRDRFLRPGDLKFFFSGGPGIVSWQSQETSSPVPLVPLFMCSRVRFIPSVFLFFPCRSFFCESLKITFCIQMRWWGLCGFAYCLLFESRRLFVLFDLLSDYSNQGLYSILFVTVDKMSQIYLPGDIIPLALPGEKPCEVCTFSFFLFCFGILGHKLKTTP